MQSSSNIHGKFNTDDVHAVCAVAKISGAGMMGNGHGERSFMSRGNRNVTIDCCVYVTVMGSVVGMVAVICLL